MHLSFLKKKKEWNCGNGIAEFHSTFHNSKSFFLPPYFGNVIATIAKNLYPLFRQCHCRKLFFFSSHFRQWHCHNCQFFFFFLSFGFPCTHSHFEHPLRQQVWAEGIATIPLPKIKNFSLLLFIFLSSTFVEFLQWYCRNSLSFLRVLNKLKQYLQHQLTSNLAILSQKTHSESKLMQNKTVSKYSIEHKMKHLFSFPYILFVP